MASLNSPPVPTTSEAPTTELLNPAGTFSLSSLSLAVIRLEVCQELDYRAFQPSPQEQGASSSSRPLAQEQGISSSGMPFELIIHVGGLGDSKQCLQLTKALLLQIPKIFVVVTVQLHPQVPRLPLSHTHTLALPTSAVSSLVSTWSSGALIPVDHLPPISSFFRFPAGLPLLAPTQVGLILSPAVKPIPHKLVQAGQFVEIRDLLGNNIALLQQLDFVQGPFQSFSWGPKPRLQELTSLSSWLHCFLAYTAIRTTDQATCDQLTYAWLLIQEYLQHGGNRWLDYDCVFQQQVAINPSLPWNTLYPGLHTSTIIGQRSGTRSFCTLCSGSDHTTN